MNFNNFENEGLIYKSHQLLIWLIEILTIMFQINLSTNKHKVKHTVHMI